MKKELITEGSELRYGRLYMVHYQGLSRRAIYAGYNKQEGLHLVLIRNPEKVNQIIPLASEHMKPGRIEYFSRSLTFTENKFANEFLQSREI